MQIIKGKKNENIYTIWFLGGFIWLILGSIIYFIPLFIFLMINDPNFTFSQEYLGSDFVVTNTFIAEILAKIVPITLFIVFLKKVFIEDFKKFKEKWIKYTLMIIVGYGLIYGVGLLLEFLYEGLGIRGTSDNQRVIETALYSPMRPLIFVMIVFGAPILEEMIFRKTFVGMICEKGKLSKWWGFAFSSITFALIHVIAPGNWIFIFQYLILSIIITASYFLSKNNIYVPMAIHLINNFMSFLLI